MIHRCTNPRASGWKYWGGRGITVCERWLTSFEDFLADMGERPPGTTIDRYPNKEGNYEPGNVRWATPTTQARNRRGNSLIEFRGSTRPLASWAESVGISPAALTWRLKHGWSIELALTISRANAEGRRQDHVDRGIGARS